MRKASLAVAVAVAVALGGHAAVVLAQKAPPLKTDKDKTLYALGVALGSNVKEFGLNPAELAVVEAGMSDAVQGKQSRVDMRVYGARIQQLAEQRQAAASAVEKKASAAFLDKMAKEKGAERTASGLVYVPEKVGTGASPKATDTVRVNYRGTLRDGTEFDSTAAHGGQPASFALDRIIPCWKEGLQKMKVGGKSKLGCPADLAYGDKGQGPIPGGAALVFEVELLGIGQPSGGSADQKQ